MDVIILAIIVIILNLLFWGAVIYFIVKFLRSKSTGLSNQQKLDILAKGADAYREFSREKPNKDILESKAGQYAAGQGFQVKE